MKQTSLRQVTVCNILNTNFQGAILPNAYQFSPTNSASKFTYVSYDSKLATSRTVGQRTPPANHTPRTQDIIHFSESLCCHSPAVPGGDSGVPLPNTYQIQALIRAVIRPEQLRTNRLSFYLGLTFANLTIRGGGNNTETVFTHCQQRSPRCLKGNSSQCRYLGRFCHCR